MPQRLDDVTGDPIRLSARQREAQLAQTIEQLNIVLRQLNAITQQVRAQQVMLDSHDVAMQLLEAEYRRVSLMTRWQRIRALCVGGPHG